LGIISIVCFVVGVIASFFVGPFAIIAILPGVGLGIPAWVMGGRDLKKIDARLMDAEGRGMTMAGWVCGIVGTILNSISLFCCVLSIVLVLAFGVAILSAASEAQKQRQQQRPQPRFEQPGAPLRLQDYLPGSYR